VTKIYTKGGDKGETGLFDGTRVSKNHPLVNAYGTVDELNSVLGIARAWNKESAYRSKGADALSLSLSESISWPPKPKVLSKEYLRLEEMLHTIQVELFELGADLASGDPVPKRINDGQVERFEQWIDELTAQLPELKNFILPTGHPVAAALHQCRTVSRRAERMIIAARESCELDAVVVRYMNRLADLFFVLARYANFVYGVEDEPWKSAG